MEKEQLNEAIDDIAEGLGFTSTPDTDSKPAELPVKDLPPDSDTASVETGDSSVPATITEESTETGEQTPESGVVADPAQVAPPVDTIPPPKTWRPEALKEWDKLPPSVKAEVAKREEDMFKGIESYKQDAGIGKTLKDIVQPYVGQLRAAGIHPLEQIKNLMHSHHVLVSGSQEQRNQVFQHLAKEYGVTFDSSGELPYLDPQIQTLNKTIDDLRSRLDSTEQRTVEATKAELQKEINTFAADPKHQHFDIVANDIAALLKSGTAANLAEAYEKAVWLNPTTRALEQTRITAENESKLKAELEAKAKADLKATAVNVKASAKRGSGTAPVGSMDDTLSETLTKIRSRA